MSRNRFTILFIVLATTALVAGCSKSDGDKKKDDMAHKGDMKKGDMKKGDMKKGDMKKGDMKKGDVKKGDMKMGDMKKGDMKMDDHAGGMARSVDIKVDGEGFHPGTVNAKAGDHLDLVFTRTSDKGCGTEVVIASTGKKYDLPLNEPVKVAFHAEKSGTVGFACGMDMLKGSIVVE